MKNKKNITLICQGLITIFLVVNIAIAVATKENTLFSYIFCNVLAMMQTFLVIVMFLKREAERSWRHVWRCRKNKGITEE